MRFLRPRITVLAQLDMKNCIFTIEDGASASATIKIGEGNFQWTEKKNMNYVKNRGVLDVVKEGDEEPVEITLEATWEYIKTSGEDISLIDIIKNPDGSYTSVDDDPCQPYATKITIVNAPVPANCGDKETFVFDMFRVEQFQFDMKAGTISLQGKCNITEPTITREAQA